MEHVMVSALQTDQIQQCIYVRASRVWHHHGGLDTGEIKEIRLVFLDQQGGSIYATVPASLVGSYIHLLHETAIYKISSFEVAIHQQLFAPVENPLVLIFTPQTIVQPVLDADEMFLEWTFRLTSLGELPEPQTNLARLVDVIGVIHGISYIGTHETHGRHIPISRRCVLLSDSSGNEIKISLWGEAAFQFNGEVIHYLGQKESAVAIFVGMTVHSHEGSTELAGTAACRWYINVDIPEINILRAGILSAFKPIAQLLAPGPIMLRSQVNGNYPMRALSALVNHDFFQNQDGMFRCFVRIWRFVPAQPWWFVSSSHCGRMSTPAASSFAQPGGYVCSDVACGCTEATLEYRLRLLGSDGTSEAEFLLSGKVARNFIGVSPQRVILNNHRGAGPIDFLDVAASQIVHTPPELAATLNAKYRFLVYVGNNNFQGNWPCFSVLLVEGRYPTK